MSDTNQAVQSHNEARDLKFWIMKEERLYFLCTENKGDDPLHGYCAADPCSKGTHNYILIYIFAYAKANFLMIRLN